MDEITNFVSKVEELSQGKVAIRELDDFKEKLKQLKKDGPDKIQVLADFDGTLTFMDSSSSERKTNSSSFHIFIRTKTLSQAYLDGFAALRTRATPIVRNPDAQDDQKEEAINKWFLEVETLTARENVTVQDIQEAVEQSGIPLREGCDVMLSLISNLRVPLTVVSAGVGEVIVHMLRDFKPKVIANFLKFDDSGRILGFTRPLVTVHNKGSISLPVDKGRHNIVLLGDAPEDSRIGESIEVTKTVLKIGFLVGGDDSRLQKYLSCYDIVLVDDPTIDTVTAVLKMIAGLLG